MKSECLKGLSITSIEETVDLAMEHLPESLDFVKPEHRNKMRCWMVRVCSAVISRNADSMVKVAESAIQEAAALAINPEYYATKKHRRDKRKALRAIVQNQQKPKTCSEIAFDRLQSPETRLN
jgi:ATP phosphoribosyltransferase